MTHTVYIAGTSEGENLGNVDTLYHVLAWWRIGSTSELMLEMVIKTTSINHKERSKISCTWRNYV